VARESRRCDAVGRSMELKERTILVFVAGVEAAMSESEMRFAHTRDRVLALVASLLTVAIVVVMQL